MTHVAIIRIVFSQEPHSAYDGGDVESTLEQLIDDTVSDIEENVFDAQGDHVDVLEHDVLYLGPVPDDMEITVVKLRTIKADA